MGAIVVQASGSGQTGCAAGNHMVSEVARVVGGENEDNVRAQALDCINRVRVRMNRFDWRFTKSTSSNITLVNGTATYTLPTTFKAPVFARLLDTNSKPDQELRYVDDAWFTHWIANQESTGRPYYYSLRNAYDDGLIRLYPVPDAGAASTWTLQVEYFGRIGVIADDNNQIDLPEEVCDVLVLGGQAYLLRERTPQSPATNMAYGDFREAMRELIAYDRRMGSDNHSRFRIGGARTPFDTTWIKIQ